MKDTIFSLATSQGKSGVAIVRISGPDAWAASCQLAGDLPQHGRGVRVLRAADGSVLDDALVLTFAAGRSFTGEVTTELHLHGSPAIVAAVLAELGKMQGLRQAQAGEFTRRALENGRLDLAQVEGLADLIDAETEAQRRQAQRVFAGDLGRIVEAWRADLLRAAALIEATIDFADEEVPEDVEPEVLSLLRRTRDHMQGEASGVDVAERIRNGFEVAIIGEPNVGKSTLLNKLAGREAAITSEIAGTTRDVIEVQMDIAGFPVTVLDTAGLRDSDDALEALGIERGRDRAERADLRVLLVTDGQMGTGDPDTIAVMAKADLSRDGAVGISGKTGYGIDALVDLIGDRLRDRSASVGIAMRARHRDALLQGTDVLDSVIQGLEDGSAPIDLVAEDIRTVLRSVESLVGRLDVEDILGEIFSSFCIGK